GRADAQILFGGGLGPKPASGPAPLDASLPTGAVQYAPPRPLTIAEPGACSSREPVCVHRAAGVDENTVMTWLYAMERAYGRAVRGLGLKPPRSDGTRGGNGALDVYVLRGSADATTELDARDVGRAFDSASAFCTLGTDNPDVDRAATMCVAEAA